MLAHRPELLVFILIIALFNGPVLVGSCWRSLIFHPAAVRSGEWWRFLTHPFVHVTWYHLLLDGTAFLTLYYSLLEPTLVRRFLYVAAAAAGSLLAAWASPASASGLCGLSGIAHGLMAVSALELVAGHSPNSAEGRVGLVTFMVVVGKAAFEALTGRMFFAFLAFGMLGDPVAVSHAGGIIGGLTALLVVRCCAAGAGDDRIKRLQGVKPP
jgi:rhomboid family GlyGly-CTERM serine protease